MPDQYLIAGSIHLPDGADRAGIKVQAVDRDLPSLELRSTLPPPLLGEALTDAEGRFQITYRLEQFAGAEAISTIAGVSGQYADLSFHIFYRNGQELSIQAIKAPPDQTYNADQVIYNAPAIFEGLDFYLDAPPVEDASEYTQLLNCITPVTLDLPLTAITHADALFLIGELGYERQPENQQHLAWLRWSALLAQETSLPVEAFYGWARIGLPDLWNQLPDYDDSDSRAELAPKLLDGLAAAGEESLVRHLLKAVEERFIPAGISERAAAIAHAVARRSQVQVTAWLVLERSPSGEALGGYTVTTLDAAGNNRDLGTDVTAPNGEFWVTYLSGEAQAARSLKFVVRGPGIVDTAEAAQTVQPGTTEPVSVRVTIPDALAPLQQLGADGHLDVPAELLLQLSEQHGVNTLADIRRRGGLNRVQTLREMNDPAIQRLDALADLERLSGDLGEISALISRQYDSVLSIAETPRTEFVASLTGGDQFSEQRATELHIAAQAQADLLNQLFTGLLADFARGVQPAEDFTPGDYYPPFPEEQ